MGLRVVGAGLGRTGTLSLKLALEQLLGGPCYHMTEVFGRPDDIAVWQRAVDGAPPDWDSLYAGYQAAVDWPTAAFWRDLVVHYPEAVVVLSVRDPDAWWRSASATIFAAMTQPDTEPPHPQLAMARDLLRVRFTDRWADEASAKAAYVAHNEAVRATVPGDRLVVWEPTDGWQPICAALGLDVPAAPFPHANSTEDFRAMVGLDQPGGGAS